MDSLPTELLHKILIKLDLKNKLECMLVCRFWYDTLDRSGLLDTLSIKDRVFLNLKEMIERQPHRANQVKILKLSLNGSIDFDKRTLCNMFPNLREIALLESDNIETSYSDSSFQFTHATSKLEKIVESVDYALTSQLAMSNMCSRLKTLDLTCDENSNNVFSQLKNMPVLDTLTLADFKLKLIDLEMVHSNIPSIKRLNLAFLTILAGEIPQRVVPATLVTNLDVYLSSAADLHTHTH